MRFARLLAPVLAALAVVGPAAPAHGRVLVEGARQVRGLSADGADLGVLGSCRFVTVMTGGGARRHVVPAPRVLCGGTPQFGAGPLVLAGTQAAWIVTGGGNTLGTLLYAVAPARTARPRVVESLEQPSIGLGSYLNGIDGGGALLAYARVKDLGEFGPDCEFGCLTGHETAIRRLVDGRPRTIVVLPELAQLLAAGGDRIVLRVGDELRILDAAGAVVASRPARGVLRAAVRGNQPVLLRADGLELLDRAGRTAEVVPLVRRARAASLLDANRGLVAYTAGREVRAVRLADGADALVERVPATRVEGAGLAGVAIGSAGVVWAVHDRCSAPGACRASVRLLTNAELAARFRQAYHATLGRVR